ncbi:sterol desaturase family protein [Pararhodonellum marinum]|uniref:sterol desaturase family protein n=1 Tax=Pararhodonellum marinum TaxID=2755358 RepID=UPI00188FF89B|nr:sterol desaturase family protein [Pararhodonellum marinum]
MLYALLYFIVGFAIMELSGWIIHKFLMHGPLWRIHKTHHQKTVGVFELNDLFSFLFGSVAVALIFLGLESLDARFWIGLGISFYGVCYFILHDVLIHRRVKWLDKPKNKFLKGIFRAHQAHHATNKKEGAVSFGLFLVPKKYFKD